MVFARELIGMVVFFSYTCIHTARKLQSHGVVLGGEMYISPPTVRSDRDARLAAIVTLGAETLGIVDAVTAWIG